MLVILFHQRQRRVADESQLSGQPLRVGVIGHTDRDFRVACESDLGADRHREPANQREGYPEP